jgi:hypothetical protein
MFGIFKSDLRRVRDFRIEYEDIRQRVIYKMNPFEQYSFISGYDHVLSSIQETIDSIAEKDLESWRKIGDELRVLGQNGWREYERMSGMNGEGGRAGSQGLFMLSLRCSANGYNIAEALTLRMDIKTFEAHIRQLTEQQFLASR